MPNDLPVVTQAPAPEAAPAPAPQAGPAPSLENPRSQTKEQLGAALTAAEQQTAPGPQAPAAAAPQVQAPSDFQTLLNTALAEQEKKFQRVLAKELGQSRKSQSEFAKLPELIQQQLEAREKAQREKALREQLTPEERLALMDQEAEAANQRKSIEQLVEERIEQRERARQAEQEGTQNFVSGLENLAGERWAELEPHVEGIVKQVWDALKSDDPEVVEKALRYYDFYEQNPGTLMWHADAAFRKANPIGAAPAPVVQALQAPAPAAPVAPVAQAAQFRQSRQAAGADASPQVRASAPNSRPASLNDMDPAGIRNMDKAKLAKLLDEAEAVQR